MEVDLKDLSKEYEEIEKEVNNYIMECSKKFGNMTCDPYIMTFTKFSERHPELDEYTLYKAANIYLHTKNPKIFPLLY